MIPDYLRNALARYGSDVVIKSDGKRIKTKAFIQPLKRKASPYLYERAIASGRFDNSCLLYIGDARTGRLPRDRAVITYKGKEYAAVTDEEYFVGGEPVYVWAVLREKKSEEDDYDDFDRQ